MSLSIIVPALASAAGVESVHESAAPAATFWAVNDVGWLFTPGSSYDLVGVNTRFGSSDGRTVTLFIYDGLPAGGSTLLRQVDFTVSGTSFLGGTFAPLSLTSGVPIFVGFSGVAPIGISDLGVNVTEDAGATSLANLYHSDDGSFSNVESGEFTSQPILQFLDADAPVGAPEPAAMVLMGSGILFLAALSRRFARR